jgi:hypothetical protein
MLFVKFGVLPTTIDIGEYMVKCPSCESDSWADVIVISNYYHFYYLPIFPINKEANIYCTKCELKRYGAPFDSKLIGNYHEVKHLYHHPWFTYIGIGIAAFVVLMMIIYAVK